MGDLSYFLFIAERRRRPGRRERRYAVEVRGHLTKRTWVLYKSVLSIGSLVRSGGRVYRTKSSEFAVLLDSVGDLDECRTIVGLIAERISRTHRFPGQTISVGRGIGCAVFPEYGAAAGEILRNADIAMSFAVGRNLGCSKFQGFFFSRPLPASDFERCLRAN